MAILKGEDAIRWLQQNPNSSYTDLTTNQKFERKPGFLENLGMNLSRPFRQGVGIAAEAGDTIGDLLKLSQGRTDLNKEDIWSTIQRAVLTDQERQDLERDPLKTGLKSGAGVLSYAVPGGGGAATTAAGRIATAAGRGLGAGALGGFGYSEEGNELGGTLGGAALGGILGGALQGGSEAIKGLKAAGLSKKLQGYSDDLKISALKKDVGVAPTMKQGKSNLISDVIDTSNAEKIKINNAEDLYKFGDEIFSRYGGAADEAAQAFDNAGGTVNVAKIKKPLIDKLATIKTQELRDPLESVLQSIDQATGGTNSISASDLLQLRREWGNLGNWNQFTPAKEQALASVWEDAYNAANSALDDSFKQVGYDQFRNVNSKLKTAIEAQNWARRAIATRGAKPVWTDMAQDMAIAGGVVGGAPGTVVGAVGSKLMQRYAEPAAAGLLSGASKVAGGASGLPPILQNIINAGQRSIPAVTGITGNQPQAQQVGPTASQPQPQTDQGLNLMLAQAILSGQISAAEANAVLSLLGMGADTQKKTEKQNLFGAAARAAGDALALLESGQAKTGKVQQFGSKFGEFFGTQDPMQTEYYANLDSARGAALSALSGANVPPSEYERLRRFIPEPTDEYNIAIQKLRNFQEQMLNYSGQGGAVVDSGSLMQSLGY